MSTEYEDPSVGYEDGVEDKEELKLTPTPPAKVLILNDDYTPAEFVVDILRDVFRRTEEEAIRIMLHIHQQGKGLAGTYDYGIAETKVAQVRELARQAGHPLNATLE